MSFNCVIDLFIWNGLFYIANDPWLAEQITMGKGNSVPLKCRLDERNVGSLWFIAGNRLVKAGLNQNRVGNFEFNGKSLRAYEEFKAKKKELIKEKAQEDQEIRCARHMGMEATMNDAVRIANNTAPSDSKTKNIRKNRKEESITLSCLECFVMLVEQGNISMLLPIHPIRSISTSC